MSLNQLLGIQEPASAHAAMVDTMLETVHWFMLVLFIFWFCFFAYTVWRFRASRNPVANYKGMKSHFSTQLELGVIVFEAFLLFGFAFPLWSKRVNEAPKPEEANLVRAVAQQYLWNFHYPGADKTFGRASADLVTASNPLGLDKTDPAGQDDLVTVNEMHLPVNQPAIVRISSKDVIHNFASPHLRLSQDAIPGTVIPTWFTPTKTGEYEIICAQLCGLGHSAMKGNLVIDTAEDYQAWVDETKALGAPTSSSGVTAAPAVASVPAGGH